MHTIITVIRKELKDTLRDRKTLISAILLPALTLPLILFGVTALQQSLLDKENTKKLKIALVEAPNQLTKYFEDSSFVLYQDIAFAAAKDSVASDDFDALLLFEPSFYARINSLQTAQVQFYFKSTNRMVKRRIESKLDVYKSIVLAHRIDTLQLDAEWMKPVAVEQIDVASTQEQLGDTLGGFIPYIFILFCFMGCMYPALDLITGEKERGTIETLLTVPASRFNILMGKTITIALFGIVAATMTLAGLVVGVNCIQDIPQEFLSSISDLISLKFVLMLLAMLLPLSLFFAGILSAVVVRASSFKEAQSYVTPMSFLVIIPAMIALMPGMDLSWSTAWVPILNVALATKEIVGGTIDLSMYTAIVVSLILFAVASVFLSFSEFSKEGNVLK
jgi:sodium transport system permease protein